MPVEVWELDIIFYLFPSAVSSGRSFICLAVWLSGCLAGLCFVLEGLCVKLFQWNRVRYGKICRGCRATGAGSAS